ncbi:substrate-binding periplasmic protein [Alkalimarinus coralli]|uniref:substrate-binding periplasmic protein n=1 Tax=Alkalimarinus coralli TaxID=2935863 RepID=UPI00202B4036|nr:transporter substrate-binding domain-containing protein [Alkalimarinus coralli]
MANSLNNPGYLPGNGNTGASPVHAKAALMRPIAVLWRVAWLLFAGLLIVAFSSVVNAKSFTLFTYHDKPPYYLSGVADSPDAIGIYKEFVNYLNRKQNKVQVQLVFQPRKRLEESLQQNRLKGGVLGVNPLWFNDSEKLKYLWSSVFMHDRDVVITRKNKTFNYQHPTDLTGKRLALPRGLYFWGVSELIELNKIWVYETSSDVQNLDMLLLNRVDATITSDLTFKYFIKTRYTQEDFAVLGTPHDQFDRRVLFPRRYDETFQVLEPIIANALSDPEWQAVLKGYHYIPYHQAPYN